MKKSNTAFIITISGLSLCGGIGWAQGHLWHPVEVLDWLYSEEAEPVLTQMLLYVPCSETLHYT